MPYGEQLLTWKHYFSARGNCSLSALGYKIHRGRALPGGGVPGPGPASHLTPAFAPSPQPCPIPPPGPRAALGPSGRALSAPPPPFPLGLPVLSIYAHGPGPLQAGPADGETTRPVSAEVPRRGGGGSSPPQGEMGQGRSSSHTHLPPAAPGRPSAGDGEDPTAPLTHSAPDTLAPTAFAQREPSQVQRPR